MNTILHSYFKTYIKRGKVLSKDRPRLYSMVNNGIKLLHRHTTPLADVHWKLVILLDYLKDAVSGKYSGYSKKAWITLIAGILYFVTPIDLIPDFMPVIGWIDDISIISFVWVAIRNELLAYEQWKRMDEPQEWGLSQKEY